MSDDGLRRESIPFVQSTGRENTTLSGRVERNDKAGATWAYRHPRTTVIDPVSDRPIHLSRVTESDSTYQKLLTGVELCSPPPPPTGRNIAYPAAAGIGYKVNNPNGTHDYQYFER